MKIKSLLIAIVLALVGVFALASPAGAAPAAHRYQNCTSMHNTYPHGVGEKGAKDHVASKTDKPVTNFHVSNSIYTANKSLDHDGDKIACEAH